MNPDVLCMGCMRISNWAATCPDCGYDRESEAESAAQLTPRTILQQKYVIGRALGQGGFGITYLAYDLEENCKLAIKEYFPAFISTRAANHVSLTPLSARNREALDYGLKRFHEEGQALYRFKDHPNVVKMIESFHANGTGYIVMNYIEGDTFKEFLARNGDKIPYAEALPPLQQVMDALRDLHSAGILHRDISPDNIYLEDGGGVRLLDFGATRYAMGEQSRSLSVVLKPGYAPEEQYRSRGNQGPWTDIYALGATFYRAIVGQTPPDAMDRLQSSEELVPPSHLGAEIPSWAETALLKALAVKAENRYPSIAEFRAALDPPSDPPLDPTTIPEFKPTLRWLFLPAFAVLFLLTVAFANNPSALSALVVTQALFFCLTLVLFALMWNAIQDGQARTSPAKAVGFMLIPVFNLYWVFQAIWGFAKDYNQYLERHSIALKKLNEKLFLACTISLVAYWIFGLFGGAATIVLLLLHVSLLMPVALKVCDGVDALKVYAPKKAIASAEKRPKTQPPPAVRLSLHCVAGEYEGQDIAIGDGEIVIGRSPKEANLILSSGEVSATHVRVRRDQTQSGAWVEDLRSLNGTFYREARSAEDAWVRLAGSRFLSTGDRFRLSGDAAEFEVRIT